MAPIEPTSITISPIADGGWGEGNDDSGNAGSENGISIGIDPLTEPKKTNDGGSDDDFVRIYPVESGHRGRAEIVFVVPNACGDLPIYFESDGPFYPGVKGTNHSEFDHDSRVLSLRTSESLSDEGMLVIKSHTDYLPNNRYVLRITDNRERTVLKEVELVKNAAIE